MTGAMAGFEVSALLVYMVGLRRTEAACAGAAVTLVA
jgi:hypothetical protein